MLVMSCPTNIYIYFCTENLSLVDIIRSLVHGSPSTSFVCYVLWGTKYLNNKPYYFMLYPFATIIFQVEQKHVFTVGIHVAKLT